MFFLLLAALADPQIEKFVNQCEARRAEQVGIVGALTDVTQHVIAVMDHRVFAE